MYICIYIYTYIYMPHVIEQLKATPVHRRSVLAAKCHGRNSLARWYERCYIGFFFCEYWNTIPFKCPIL